MEEHRGRILRFPGHAAPTSNRSDRQLPAFGGRPALHRAILRAFDPATYTAAVQLSGSLTVYLEGVAVALEIEPQAAVAGARCLVLFFDRVNAQDGLVVAIYGGVGRTGFTGIYGQTLYNASTFR